MRLGFSAKLIGGLGIVLVVMAVVAAISFAALSRVVNLYTQEVYANAMVPASDLGKAQVSLHRMQLSLLEALSGNGEGDDLALPKAKIVEYEKDLASSIDEYGKTELAEGETELLARFRAAWFDYRAARDNVLSLQAQGKLADAFRLFNGGAREKMLEANDALERLIEIKDSAANRASRSGMAVADQIKTLQLVVIFLGILIGLVIAYLLSRSVSHHLGSISSAARGIAEGDLDQKINVHSNDEIGDVAKSFTDMIGYLREMADIANAMNEGDLTRDIQPKSERDSLGNAFRGMVHARRQVVSWTRALSDRLLASSQQLSSTTEQASSATKQMSSAVEQLAVGAQTQATAAQTAAKSIQQLTEVIDQIAEGAQHQSRAVHETSATVARMSAAIESVSRSSQVVATSARKAQDAAESGAVAVGHTVQGMSRIRETVDISTQQVRELGRLSDQIGRIVETIDDIAEQTNLLALNAAIEAARAGVHGKGFAVVADEVRKLAERSARATKEITQIIRTVQKGAGEAVAAMEGVAREVEEGSKLSAAAGQSLQEILQTVHETSKQMQEIATAASEMTKLSSEVVRATDLVSSVVEENTAATEEMAARSSEVSQTVDSVAAVSEESAVSVEEVSAAAEEVSAQMDEALGLAQTLAQMAEELRLSFTRFKLGDESSTSDIVARRRKSDWGRTDLRDKESRTIPRLRPA